MTEQDQVAALAKLDGVWEDCQRIGGCLGKDCCCHSGTCDGQEPYPDYLTSYDAIIPLVRKCWETQLFAPEKFYQAIPNYYPHILTFIQHTTAKELSEALLRATGKWKE